MLPNEEQAFHRAGHLEVIGLDIPGFAQIAGHPLVHPGDVVGLEPVQLEVGPQTLAVGLPLLDVAVGPILRLQAQH